MDVVLIDFDGTITRTDTTRVLVFSLLKLRPWRLFAVLQPLFRLASGGTEEQIQQAKDRCVGNLLKGLSEKRLQQGLLRYRRDVVPMIRPRLAEQMRTHASSGRHVLVVTASAGRAVSEALRDFPVEVLGTRYESRDNRFTGAVEGECCYGAAKVIRILQWSKQFQASPRFVEGWSDALSDLPMLQLAETRIWVCRQGQVDGILEHDPQGKFLLVE